MIKEKTFYKFFMVLALSLALQNLLTYGVNLMDTMMLGRYSQDAMGGVSHQSDLSALGAVELVGLEVHRTRANVGQKEILVAFQMGDVAAVEKIIPRIVVIMSHAGDIVKQPPSRCGRR